MPFFSKVFRGKEAASKKNAKDGIHEQVAPLKPRWEDAWTRQDVEPSEVQELIRGCTTEIKSRGLGMPFLLLPYRPASDPSAARAFIRNFFSPSPERGGPLYGERLMQELRMAEPPVLCSIMKWCWSRLSGGVVTWEAYELFKIGEQDSNEARDAFTTFLPLSTSCDARTKIIFDFFELLAAIAAHGKTNGLTGRKLSRFAGWWAFEHKESSSGFDGSYKDWASAADATSHLFFAYLRSLSPDPVRGGKAISMLPLSLQDLLDSSKYPPLPQASSSLRTSKVVMIVDTVSPTPFSLLRRAKNFHYRDDDLVLQQFSDLDDPVQALTDECRRVLTSISSANESSNLKTSTSLRDASWSRFEDLGFGGFTDEFKNVDLMEDSALGNPRLLPKGLRTAPASRTDLGRPTTPSWADFLSSGFVDDANAAGSTSFLPPDKVLPPIDTRVQSSQSHKRPTEEDSTLEPGELANITSFSLDDAFWWVWITSLAGEEPLARKAAFGRCALVETSIGGKSWLLIEELIKGAAPEQDLGAYVAEKKSRFGFSKRGRLTRSKSSAKGTLNKVDPVGRSSNFTAPTSKASIAPDQHAKIQAAAAALQQKQHALEEEPASPRRARQGGDHSKTNSVMTLQPNILNEAAPAMQWAKTYDRNNIRAKYLGDSFAGKGSAIDLPTAASAASIAPTPIAKDSPPMPQGQPTRVARDESAAYPKVDPDLVNMLSKGPDQGPTARSGPSTAPTSSSNQPAMEAAQLTHSPNPPAVPEKAAQVAPPPKETRVSTAFQPETVSKKPLPVPKDQEAQSPTGNQFGSTKAADTFEQIKERSANGAFGVAPPSPESPKESAGKLRKKNPPTGFKGLFNRKKENVPPKPPAYTASSSASAVSAAKAALEAKASSNHKAPEPLGKVTTKRFSTIGRKKPMGLNAMTEPPIDAPRSQSQVPESLDERPVSTIEGTPNNISSGSISAIDPNEERQAEQEFRTFDQGPAEPTAAVAPESPSPAASISTPRSNASAANLQPSVEDRNDNTSDESDNDLAPTVSPNDRWAQIRKNAAERAARQSEEQSRQTDRTDDGETSGEETIESRVARIKARVAELTGNMEPVSRRS